MQFTVDILDGSAELDELMDCVQENNTANPDDTITEKEYIDNIINGWLTNRVIGIYVHHAKTQSVETLASKFGKAKEIKVK